MIKSNQRFLNALNALSDGIIILCAYLFSQWFWLDVVKSGGNMAAVSGLNHGAGAAACIYAVVTVSYTHLNHAPVAFRNETTDGERK